MKSLSESAEQISAFVMCKSTINAETLDYNTFIQLYQNNLYEKATGFTPDEISKQLDEIDEIYKKFKDHQKSQESVKRTQTLQEPSKNELNKAMEK